MNAETDSSLAASPELDLDADFLREQAREVAEAREAAAAPDPEDQVHPAEPRSEMDRLDPDPTPRVLVSGTKFDLEPLKLRQFLRLLRIVTRGASGILSGSDLDFEDPQLFAQNLLGMVLFALPEAEEETVDFLKSMVKPSNLTGDVNKDLIRLEDLYRELDNPDLEDVVTIMQCIVETEGEDLRGLGKRLSSMFKVAQKTGMVPQQPQ